MRSRSSSASSSAPESSARRSMVAGVTGDAGWMLACWVAGGVVSLIGALCYAELASTYPHAGGDYHFLTRAYGRDVSFLYAWARATVINTGSIALLAFVFGDYVVAARAARRRIRARSGQRSIVVALTRRQRGRACAPPRARRTGSPCVRGRRPGRDRDRRRPGRARRRRAAPPCVRARRRRSGCSASRWCSCCSPTAAGTRPPTSRRSCRAAAARSSTARREPRDHRRCCIVAVNLALLHGLRAAGDSPTARHAPRRRHDARVRAARRDRARGVRCDRGADLDQRDDDRRRAHQLRDGPRLAGAALHGRLERGARRTRRGTSGAERDRACAGRLRRARSTTASRRWSSSPRPCSGLSCCSSALRSSSCAAAIRDEERPFRVPLYPLTPIVFCAACAWLAWSSVSYAASRNAVHVSLIVMATGVVAWLFTRRHAAARANAS